MNLLPPIGLVVVIGGFWGWHWLRERRFRAAVAELTSRFEGRYEPGTHTSGGNLFIRLDGRDIVFIFYRGSSQGPATTTVGAVLKKQGRETLALKGREAVARVPRLGPYSRWFHGAGLRIGPHEATVVVAGMIVEAARLVDLAGIVASLAAELEGPTSPP